MTIKQPLFPQYGSTQVLTSAASSASAAIHFSSKQLRVVNTGAAKAYFRTYNSNDGAQSATTADYCLPPNTGAVVSKMGHNAIAHISATGTTLEVMTGEGF